MPHCHNVINACHFSLKYLLKLLCFNVVYKLNATANETESTPVNDFAKMQTLKKLRNDKGMDDIFGEKDLAQAEKAQNISRNEPNEDVLSADIFSQQASKLVKIDFTSFSIT